MRSPLRLAKNSVWWEHSNGYQFWHTLPTITDPDDYRRPSGYTGTGPQPYDPIFVNLVRFSGAGTMSWGTDTLSTLNYTKVVNPPRSAMNKGKATGVGILTNWAGAFPAGGVYAVVESAGKIFAVVHQWSWTPNDEYTGSGTPGDPDCTLDGPGDRHESSMRLCRFSSSGELEVISEFGEGHLSEVTQLYPREGGGVFSLIYWSGASPTSGAGFIWGSWSEGCSLEAEVESSLGGAPPNYPSVYDWGTHRLYAGRQVGGFNGVRPTWQWAPLSTSFELGDWYPYPVNPNDRLGLYSPSIVRNGQAIYWGTGIVTPKTPPIPAGMLRTYYQRLDDATYTWVDHANPYPEGMSGGHFDLHADRILWCKPGTVDEAGEDNDDRELWVISYDGIVEDSWHLPKYLLDEGKRYENTIGGGGVIEHGLYPIGTIGGSVVLDMGPSFSGGFVPGGLNSDGVRANPWSAAIILTGEAGDFRMCRAWPSGHNPFPTPTADNPASSGQGWISLNLNGGSSPVFGIAGLSSF